MSTEKRKHIIIIGGGAAGFFAANILAEKNANCTIQILEQGKKVMQKIKVSGGGRCNVTNANIKREDLANYYPRGWKLLRKLFSTFNNQDMIKWLADHGVETKTEADNRMFPITNDSQTIIDVLRIVDRRENVEVNKSCKVLDLNYSAQQWHVSTNSLGELKADILLIASGSSNFIYQLLKKKSVDIVPPRPSLFTFNIPKDIRIKDIPGIAVQQTIVKIVGEKSMSTGPTLITHWGLSGPAILKLSSWAAIQLNDRDYKFKIAVNWTGEHPETSKTVLQETKNEKGGKLLTSYNPFSIPKRLWINLVLAADINDTIKWSELSKKKMNALHEQVCNCQFQINGKSTFKEEFVTCGGVALSDVQSKTLAHKHLPNLFFAGEVLNIDAITGGFNFQSTWTTAYVATQAIFEVINE